jgi:DNA-binding CsgD family transcriptional regulator
MLRQSTDLTVNEAGPATMKAGVIGAIVSWCSALNGTSSLQSALVELTTGLGAEAGLIVRTRLADPRPVRIAACDLARADALIRPLTRAFGDSFFGAPLLRARGATIWQATAQADDATGDPTLGEWQASRGMREFIVLVLTSENGTRDHIELHFRDRLNPDLEALLALMLPDMARIWSNRLVGLITRTIINHRPTEAVGFRSPAPVRILDANNPTRLSRAEFRVCLLLSRGLMVQAVAQELVLSESTIRTHLRNIYAKTECNSLAELVFRLIDRQPAGDHAERRIA